MKLLKLTLNNFKGIRHFELDTQGRNVAIFGDNATGKTTVFDAFLWLLFDKDSQNKKDFQIKTLTEDGEPIHNLDHEVEGVFDINGQELTLRKVYSEVWTKKRGSATATFTGHTTDYFIDGVPVKKNEYVARIDQIVQEDIFKLLTNPAFFNEQLRWQDRRKILLEVCGDISDADVIASDKALAKLPGILGNRKLDDCRKMIAARQAEINKELDKIPVRIDEVSKGLPDISGIKTDLTKDIEKLQQDQQEKLAELNRIQTGGEIAEQQKRLRELEGELLDLCNQEQEKQQKATHELRKKLRKAEEELSDVKAVIRDRKFNLSMGESTARNMEAEMKKLRDRWRKENDQEFEGETICPTCGQDLPEEKVEEARANFNRAKAETLTEITEKGKSYKAALEELKETNAKLENEIRELELAVVEKEKDVAELQAEIDSLSITTPVPEMQAKEQEIDEVKATIESLRSGNKDAAEQVRQEIYAISDEIKALQEAQGRLDAHREDQDRIKELETQEKELAAEFERLEHEAHLTDRFVRTKVEMLTGRINSRFKYARFKMFETQVNGGVAECCETLFEGVPYGGGLNNGARINVGLDAINTFAEFYRFDAPIFVDNAESVTELIPTRGQMIKLVVSEKDKKLRVEVE